MRSNRYNPAHRLASILVLLALFVGCGDGGNASSPSTDPMPDGGLDAADAPVDGATDAVGLDDEDGADGADDAGEADPDGDQDVCVPRTCADISPSCGTHDDGCGSELNCGECSCTASTFEQDCPSQPCLVPVGCSDSGQCEYEPITCGGQACERCADGLCSDDELRQCSGQDSCPAEFCDLSPVTDAQGTTTFQNTCIPSEEVHIGCSICELGAYECVDGGFACVEPNLPNLEELRPNCASTVRPTVVYLDPTYSGGMSDGTRQAPYTTFSDAFDGMRNVDAKALVIGGSPELTVPKAASGRADAPFYGFRVPEGISVLGGYTGAPDFERDRSMKPTVYAPHTSIALEASDIQRATTISGITFENSRDAIPDTSYGAVIRRSPGLELVDVTIIANSPPRAGEPVSIAAPMAASTTSVAQRAADSYDGPAYSNPFIDRGPGFDSCVRTTDLPAQRQRLSCPIHDTAAQQYYAATTVPNHRVSGASGGQGGAAAFDNKSYPGRSGGDPLGGGQNAAGGVDSSGDDAVAYSGSNQFAPPGASGSRGGELDADRLWLELGDADYGAIGHAGRSGGGGASAVSGSRSYLDSAGVMQSICFYGPPGGNGGSGGCGGLGGRGGRGGDWSIGILLDDSAGTDFRGISLQVAEASPGQLGSAGGEPADGADGDPAQVLDETVSDTYDYTNTFTSTSTSHAGGNGAAGQWGGHGGHGAGGSTVGVLCVDAVLTDTTGFQFSLGQPGAGASGKDPSAPAAMPAPTAAPDGQAYQTFQCDPPSSD